MRSDKNIFWIDAVKALCMIGVYVAHAEVYYPATKFSSMHFIAPFYVTAFFFVNGYLYSMKKIADADDCGISSRHDVFIGQLTNVLFKLVIPTVIFSTLIFVPRNLFHHEPISVGKYAFMVLGGCANWFTAALACLQIYIAVLYLLFGSKRYWYLIFAVVFFALALFLQRVVVSPFPWYWKSGMVGILPFVLGMLYQRYEQMFERKGFVSVLPLLLYIVYCALPCKVQCNVAGVQFDLPGVIVMCFGILSVIRLSKWLPGNRWLAYVGRHSIVFYFLSGVFPAFWGAVLKKVFHGAPNYGIVLLSIIASLLSAAACSWVIYRFLPFMVDIRKLSFKKVNMS